MIDVKIFKKSKQQGGSSSSGGGYAGSTGTGKAGQASYADKAGKAAYADEAGYAVVAGDLVGTSPAYDRWLRKDINDTSVGTPTFTNGIKAGEWSEGVSGAALWQDSDGNWHFESDYVNIRKKLTATEVAIQDVHHVGGQMLLTAASCSAAFVVDKGTYYRVFFLRVDNEGKAVNNLWRVGDQAYCQTFNLEQQDDETLGNHFFWRLVTGVSSEDNLDTSTYTVGDETIDASLYHYVDLSKDTAAASSDAPRAGDDIVQLGYRGTDNDGRQTAILIAGASADDSSPFIRLFEGIDSFTLPSEPEQLKPGDNRLKGVLRMMEGSTLADGRDINNLGTARGNLLKNTGFTGDFESVEITEENQTITDATPIYSDPLKHWEATDVAVVEDSGSASGYAAQIGTLSQTVDGGFSVDSWYMLSALVYGTVTMSAGGSSKETTAATWQRVDMAFQASTTDGTVTFTGSGKVAEIMLTAGNIPTEWHRASTDNDKSMAEFFGLSYLTNAISNASTSVLGGLILSQLIKVGNYRDGEMVEETGGMNGAMNDGQSPFLWGGGSMEQAIYTIAKYAQNPAYQATDAEVANMAKFVVTHGGRAILNDIVLRGYIYALGGEFNGTIHASDGEFEGADGMYKISLNAASRMLSVYGPSHLDLDGNPHTDAIQTLYMNIGGWARRPFPRGYLITPTITMRTLNVGLATFSSMQLDAVSGLLMHNESTGADTQYNNYVMGGPNINTLLLGSLPTSEAGCVVGQVWNDNGTLKIKTE